MFYKNRILVASTALVALTMARAFDNKGWKKDDDGNLFLKDGNPVYLDSNGNEMAVDPGTITRLNGEAKNHRTRAETAEASLKAFEGLDADAARKALDTVSKIDQKTLIDSGEVDKVKDEISKSFQTQLDKANKERDDAFGQRDNLVLTNAFGSSKFLADRVAVPNEMFQATFGRHFKVEDGKVVPYGHDGQKMYSPKRAGEIATLDEACEVLVNGYQHKDAILKADDHQGSGGNGGGGGRGGLRTIPRAEFDKMGPVDKANTAKAMQAGEVRVVD